MRCRLSALQRSPCFGRLPKLDELLGFPLTGWTPLAARERNSDLLRHGFLRNVLLAILAVALALPAYSILVSYPAFNRQLISITEEQAVRLGRHLQRDLLGSDEQLDLGRLASSAFENEVHSRLADGLLVKLRVFDSTGRILYSTEPTEVGRVNDNDYFHSRVAVGEVLSNVVQKGGRAMDGTPMTLDLVETYFPIMLAGEFAGAFELYSDITGPKRRQDQLLWNSSLIMLAAVLAIVAALPHRSHPARLPA
jgi:hypothetical protein